VSDLSLYQRGYAPSKRDSRWAAGEISRGGSEMQVRQSRVEGETELTIAKGESYTAVTAYALTDVTRIGKLQEQCELQVPTASPRLNMIADQHAFGMAGLQMDHERRMRRC
jgi:hypothetical protein